ncbi:MAG: polyhydroxybutyrate depolymerase [Pseudomonadota bacterium]
MRLVSVLIAGWVGLSLGPVLACGGAEACPIGERSYHAQPPEGWDRASPLPVLIHFHGWGRQSHGVMNNQRVAGPASENGLLLIAPNGLGKSWDFWDGESRDTGFTVEVLADAARRWPIDMGRVYVSGFSYGGAMAWRLACERGAAFAAAYLPISGALWRQNREACSGGPARVLHVHGLADTVFGLPYDPGIGPADGVSLWRRVNRTGDVPEARYAAGRFDCRDWQGAALLTLCTHEKGHFIPADWLDWALKRVLADAARGAS